MPKSPKRQRHDSPRAGDNTGSIRRAAGGFLDLNVSYALGTLWAMHYTTPGKCGYLYVDTAHGRRRMSGRERRRSVNSWGLAGMKKLSRKNGERPLTLDAALAKCAHYGAAPIMECKSRVFGMADAPWNLLNKLCIKHDVPNWCKALVTMWGFKGKVLHAARAGVPLAAIFGKGLRGRFRRVTRTRQIERGWKDGTKVYATW